eukprot:scaffold490104_cov47-Attheya_sp.AAC.1
MNDRVSYAFVSTGGTVELVSVEDLRSVGAQDGGKGGEQKGFHEAQKGHERFLSRCQSNVVSISSISHIDEK